MPRKLSQIFGCAKMNETQRLRQECVDAMLRHRAALQRNIDQHNAALLRQTQIDQSIKSATVQTQLQAMFGLANTGSTPYDINAEALKWQAG